MVDLELTVEKMVQITHWTRSLPSFRLKKRFLAASRCFLASGLLSLLCPFFHLFFLLFCETTATFFLRFFILGISFPFQFKSTWPQRMYLAPLVVGALFHLSPSDGAYVGSQQPRNLLQSNSLETRWKLIFWIISSKFYYMTIDNNI